MNTHASLYGTGTWSFRRRWTAWIDWAFDIATLTSHLNTKPIKHHDQCQLDRAMLAGQLDSWTVL